MNKIDLVPQAQRRELTNTENTVYISAQKQLGLNNLLSAIDAIWKLMHCKKCVFAFPKAKASCWPDCSPDAYPQTLVSRQQSPHGREAPESLARTLRKYEVEPIRGVSGAETAGEILSEAKDLLKSRTPKRRIPIRFTTPLLVRFCPVDFTNFVPIPRRILLLFDRRNR